MVSLGFAELFHYLFNPQLGFLDSKRSILGKCETSAGLVSDSLVCDSIFQKCLFFVYMKIAELFQHTSEVFSHLLDFLCISKDRKLSVFTQSESIDLSNQ